MNIKQLNETLDKFLEDSKEVLNDNFWKWFGDSITIDEDGNPMIFYHGTKQKFNTFKSKYDDKLIFFAYDKKFALDWGGQLSNEQKDIEQDVDDANRKKRNQIAKWFNAQYGDSKDWTDETWKEYEKQQKRIKTKSYHKAGIDTKIMPVFLKVHKIFVPERDYELVLDDIIKWYNFPTSATDNSKEIESLKAEKQAIIDNVNKEDRDPTEEESDQVEAISDKIYELNTEKRKLDYFINNDLKRIKQGAWIYFEHGPIIDKIFDEFGYDAIQLSEAGGLPTTLAVREGRNQIKSIFAKEFKNTNNIYESQINLNEQLEKFLLQEMARINGTIEINNEDTIN